MEIDPVNVASYKFTRTEEIFEGSYSTLSYKFKVDRVKLGTLSGHSGGYYFSFGDKTEFDPVRLATDRLARIQKSSLGNIASFYTHPSHGIGFYLDEGNTNYVFVIDLYEVTTYDFARSEEISVANTTGYYPTPNYGLEAGLVVPPETKTFNYSGDHSSVPSHKLDVGLVKPITSAFAWIKGGIDTIGKIVSPFHWYVAIPAPGPLA